jgi:hypothetical protein
MRKGREIGAIIGSAHFIGSYYKKQQMTAFLHYLAPVDCLYYFDRAYTTRLELDLKLGKVQTVFCLIGIKMSEELRVCDLTLILVQKI